MIKFFFILFIFSFQVFAHQPKLIFDSPNKENPYIIKNPEISKAFYGKLSGKPHYYEITSNKDFLFYSGILTPKKSEDYIWISIDVLDQQGNILYQADGEFFDWVSWYEPYARDYYWKGPEIGIDTNKEFKTSFSLDKGTYFIKVYNKLNQGHYSLAVGEAEFFGSNLWEQILTWTPILFYIGPVMDIYHWNKFDVRAYIPHIILFVLIFFVYLIISRLFRKN